MHEPVAIEAVDPEKSPIFLLGTGRSGTTLLRQILNAHPRIYLTNEAFFYTYGRFSPRLSATEWLERYCDTFSFSWLQIAPEEVRAALPDTLERQDIAQVYKAIMRIKAARQGKPRFGEKSPMATSHLDRIFSDFPDARVIYIMRDPRATIVSYERMPWGMGSLGLASNICAKQMKLVEPYFDRIHELKLEDLLQSPRRVLGDLLEFIGEPWDDAVLDHTQHSPIDDVAPFPWFIGATRKKPTASSGPPLWLKTLSPAWIRIIERNNALGMRRYGYEPAKLATEPSFIDKAKARLLDMPEALRFLYRWSKAIGDLWAFRSGEKHRISPQTSMEAHLTFNPKAWQHYPGFEMPVAPQPRQTMTPSAADVT